MDYLDSQREIWDSLATESEEHPLRAVISKDDMNNYYFDNAIKRIFNQTIKIRNNYKVLDLGCGVGRMTFWLVPKVEKIIGIDISPKMIEIAKKKAILSDLKNIGFFVSNGNSLEFEDADFDLIICIGVLKYIIDDKDFKQMVREMCRVTKTDGYVAIIDEVDYKGPILSDKEIPGGQSLLRHPNYYISLFEDCNMKLVGHYSMYHKSLFGKYMFLVRKIKLDKYRGTFLFLSKIVIDIDLLLDSV
jgi:ubiquinone/menaquinone biosynthesis C-methylase UbiE